MSERQDGGERRRLDRAPGARYASATERGPAGGAGGGAGGGSGSSGMAPRRRAILAAVLVADAGALLFFALGLFDLGVGLLAIAAFVGWVTGVALIWWGRDAVAPSRLRLGLAAFLGGWAVVFGILVDWIYALIQGGVLGPIDYVLQRYGAWGPLAIVVGALVAAWRAR
jgi:hypothetical protein